MEQIIALKLSRPAPIWWVGAKFRESENLAYGYFSGTSPQRTSYIRPAKSPYRPYTRIHTSASSLNQRHLSGFYRSQRGGRFHEPKSKLGAETNRCFYYFHCCRESMPRRSHCPA